MPPVPKKKHTSGRAGRREFGKRKILNLTSLTKCPSCGKLRFSHRACASCGFTYTK